MPYPQIFYSASMLDSKIFQRINDFAGDHLWLDLPGVFFAKYFPYIFFLILVIVLFKALWKNWQFVKNGVLAILAAVLARGLAEVIRWVMPRPRPFVNNHVNLLINYSDEPGFPSGHASFFFALSTVIFFYNKKAGILMFAASFLISISRVFVGVHWPLDILAGALVGVFSGLIVMFIILFSRRFFSTVKKE